MKKFLSCLLIVVLLVSLVVSLIACDSDELKGLTYVDENGNVVTVKKIKKTDDAEQVAAAVMALAAKEETVSAVSQLLISLDANVAYAGTQNETAFENNLSASAKVGISGPASKDYALSEYLKASKAYASIALSGKMADVNISQIIGDESLKYEDFTATKEYSESAEIFVDSLNVYTKTNLSAALVEDVADLGIDLTEANGKVGVMYLSTALSTALPLIDSKVDLAKIFSENNSWEKTAKSIIKLTEDDDDEDEESTEATTEEPKYSDWENLVTVVRALHITITKTKGSVVTFNATFNADSLRILKEKYDADATEEENAEFEEFLAKFTGSISASLELDAKTMLDFTLSISAGDYLKANLDNKVEEGLTFTSATFNATISVSTQTAIPTLSQEEKDGATAIDVSSLIKTLTKRLKKS